MLSSCSKDDEGNVEENEILGKWFYVSTTVNGEKEVFNTECEKGSYVEFFSDGVMVWKEIDNEDPCEYDQSSIDYKLAGDVLEIVADDPDPWEEGEVEHTSWDIITLTDKTLIIADEYFDEYDQETTTMKLELRRE